MIGAVICTHKQLASALLETAQMIVGDFPQVATVSVDLGDGTKEICDRITQAIEEVDTGEGVLIFCDMFGGTPSNVSLSFLRPATPTQTPIDIVTGLNLPMLLKFYSDREGDMDAVCKGVQSHGRDNIFVAGELLGRK